MTATISRSTDETRRRQMAASLQSFLATVNRGQDSGLPEPPSTSKDTRAVKR